MGSDVLEADMIIHKASPFSTRKDDPSDQNGPSVKLDQNVVGDIASQKRVAETRNMEPVHNEREMDRVLEIEGIELVGINNRDLGILVSSKEYALCSLIFL
ncbi:hypothetical protein PHJA_002447900 [Phtheirospermum japonicum]|uniref:Uncharacterized protein n=1 Tax=Phtheirospermum japonicum TaxID=374723 RepID=A0A830CT36_9LAMI|nr:hypothetical protein PHJA_002447900 [Phtheirospermum japonicum]